MDPIANFSGLASGIQWHDMIDQIMKLEAARSVDPLTNRVGTQTARIDAWKVYEGLVSKLKSASLALRDGASFEIYNADASTNAAGRALVSATASTKRSSPAVVRAMFVCCSWAMVLESEPLDEAEEQKLPKPWVGSTLTVPGSSAARRWADRYWARVSSSVTSSSMRSVRPTVP